MSDRPKRQRRHLPVMEGGRKYTGWMGFVDGEPHAYTPTDGEDEYHVDVYFSRRQGRRFYEDVCRVTITVEVEDE